MARTDCRNDAAICKMQLAVPERRHKVCSICDDRSKRLVGIVTRGDLSVESDNEQLAGNGAQRHFGARIAAAVTCFMDARALL